MVDLYAYSGKLLIRGARGSDR